MSNWPAVIEGPLTEEDIQKGRPEKCEGCLLARFLNRVLPHPGGWSVHPYQLPGTAVRVHAGERVVYTLDEATALIGRAFDEGVLPPVGTRVRFTLLEKGG